MKTSPALQINWAIVKDWSESVRYDMTITEGQATNLYWACTTPRTGILSCIRGRW